MNDHQIRLWKKMIDLIQQYLSEETNDYFKLVGELEGTLDAAEIKDNKLINRWYEFWTPLEIRRAVQKNKPDKAKSTEELIEMKKFLVETLYN